MTFGQWTVVEATGIRWLCRCSCGTEAYAIKYNLLRGNSSKCIYCRVKGVRPYRWSAFRTAVEGLNSPHAMRMLHKVRMAIRRCTDATDKAYGYYGGRGITVQQSWIEHPEEFVKYLLTLPEHDDPSLELDRKDNNKGYEEDNLQFTTHAENMANMRMSLHGGPGISRR